MSNDKKAHRANTDFPLALSEPAWRALTTAGYTRLEQLRQVAEKEIASLHGMGPKGMTMLNEALAEKGWSFAKKK